jgi:aspartate racemase
MNDLKHIGILAITAPGASLTYRKLLKSAIQHPEINGHPDITLHSINYAKYKASKGKTNMGDSWSKLLKETITKLENAGAELIICPSNTPHKFYNDIIKEINVEWLHIVESSKNEILKKDYKKPLLLGTKETLISNTFEPFFKNTDVSLIKPNENEIDHINQIISDELIKDNITNDSKYFFESLIKKYRESDNIDSVILGCTELPIIIDESITDLHLVDTTQTLADYALEHAIKQ